MLTRRATLAVSSAAVVVAVAGCGGTSVARYCEYGAVSEAQLEGCEEHVTEAEVNALDTNAARYARGELAECRSDAGPFCR